MTTFLLYWLGSALVGVLLTIIHDKIVKAKVTIGDMLNVVVLAAVFGPFFLIFAIFATLSVVKDMEFFQKRIM